MARAVSAPRASATGRSNECAAVELAGLWREFADRPVLRDISLRLGAGQTLTLLGPNGAGKTTFLRILATLLRPTGGRVSVLGAELPREAWSVRARIGFLGHEPLLYRDLTCLENLAFQARLHGIASGEARGRELLGAVGLERRASELVRNLSAGMVRRLDTCRAVLHEPELLLLDEPHSHLDPEAAGMVEGLIGAGAGRTRILVTHDPDEGLAEGDEVLALRGDGSAAYSGPASGLSPGDARAIYGGGR